jgi:hypothetical protein
VKIWRRPECDSHVHSAFLETEKEREAQQVMLCAQVRQDGVRLLLLYFKRRQTGSDRKREDGEGFTNHKNGR